MWPEVYTAEILGRSFTVHGYGLMISVGAIAWLVLAVRGALQHGLDVLAERMGWILLVMILAAWGGGKLLYVLIYSHNSNELVDSPGDGFVYFGSMLAVIPTGAVVARILGVAPFKALDTWLAPAPLLHVFGRTGCFLAGCCYGRASELPWAVALGGSGGGVHPVQLYEAAGELVLFLLLWFWMRPRQRFDGQVALAYVIGYCLLRLVTDQFRGNPAERVFQWATPSTFIAAGLIAVACAVWIRLRPVAVVRS